MNIIQSVFRILLFSRIPGSRISILFNVSHNLDYVSKVWRGAKVILIPKSGNDDYNDSRAFRPNTLS